MTRKDFEAMAGVFRDAFAQTQRLYDTGIVTLTQRIERDLATQYVRTQYMNLCEAQNPRFDRVKFIEASRKRPY